MFYVGSSCARSVTIAGPLLAALMLLASPLVAASSLEFFGNGSNDIDRVKIRIDDESNSNPGPPADIGNEDFSIEFWLKPGSNNTEGSIGCGANYNWILGNIIFDRDRFNQTRAFGVSLGAGRVVFGVKNSADQNRTICGSTDLRDGSWHHVAVQRRRSDGFLSLYVDGSLEASADGPDGDISYPDDGVPGNFCNGSCNFSDPFIVIGAEKHDVAAAYFGLVDELRLSNTLRYNASFTPSQQPFAADGSTVGLYHFDEGAGNVINDSSNGAMSPGQRRFGGSPAGPAWVSDSPIVAGGSPGTLQFSASDYNVGEGDGSQTIAVTRTGGSAGAVTVDYATADSSATSGSDYSATNGALSWLDNDAAAKSFAVSIVDDGDSESDETIDLLLTNATGGATLAGRTTAVLTISDNDALTPGQVQLSASNYSVAEDAGPLAIQVSRTGGSDGAVSVSYNTGGGTATSGSDYQQASGTLSWGDGVGGTQSFDLTVIDDTDVEGNETIDISLGAVTGGAALGSPSTATVTISDNDVSPVGSVAFSASGYSVAEDGSSIQVTVNRSGGSAGAVSIDYATANGTATAGSDYQPANGVLSWADGEGGAKSFGVTVTDDSDDEANETVSLSLSNPVGGVVLGSPSAATLTINDNDGSPIGSVAFSAGAYSVAEDGSSVQITVNRSGGSGGAVSIDYATANGTATAGSDYQAANGVLSWADGEGGAKSFGVTVTDDSNDEANETVSLSLSNPVGGVALGSPSAATLTINDNDTTTPPPPPPVAESGGGGVSGSLWLSVLLALALWTWRSGPAGSSLVSNLLDHQRYRKN